MDNSLPDVRDINHKYIVVERDAIMGLMLQGNISYKNILPIPRFKGDDGWLKYCPLCVKEDREKYGETYWHRCHQLQEVNICYKHKCFLHNSKVSMRGKAKMGLVAAEYEASEEQVLFVENGPQKDYQIYIVQVFLCSMDYQNRNLIGDMLSKSIPSRFLYSCPTQRKSSEIVASYNAFAKGVDMEARSRSQINAIFGNRCYTLSEICLMGMFLGIEAQRLANPITIKDGRMGDFKRKARTMYAKGMSSYKIAKELDTSGTVLRKVMFGIEYHQHKENGECSTKRETSRKRDWVKYDLEMLPLVKKELMELNGIEKPTRITRNDVIKRAGISSSAIYKMPLCLSEIDQYQESNQEYWARLLEWAINKALKSNKRFCITRIQELSHLQRCEMQSCLELIKDENAKKVLESVL